MYTHINYIQGKVGQVRVGQLYTPEVGQVRVSRLHSYPKQLQLLTAVPKLNNRK